MCDDCIDIAHDETGRVAAERDALQAAVDRALALADRVDAGGIWSRLIHTSDLRAVLAPQELHAPAQDATSTPDGSEGGETESGAQAGVHAPDECGDRITTWHGRIGPCVQVGQHTLHDDGAGAVWSWTETTATAGEKP
jgi:hypothetical protein